MSQEENPLRLLVLMRHAEAKSGSTGGDIARELNKNGRKSAVRTGEWLRSQGVRPDAVIVSPSTRTVQTWEMIREGGLSSPEVWSDTAIYEAFPEDIVESINAVPEGVRTLVVIGHAPGVPDLAASLEDHTELDDAGRELMDRWPTAALAVVTHQGPWSQFPGPKTAVAAFRAPERV